MGIGRICVAIVALALIGAAPAYGAGTVTITINGSGTVSGTVNDLNEITCSRDAAGTYSGQCSVFVPNVRDCDERPTCFPFPGTLTLSASDSDPRAGFVSWSGACTGTERSCSILVRSSTAVTATYGDNAAPVVALTAPGGGFVRGAVTLTADASDNFGVAKVDLALGAAAQTVSSGPFAATFDSAQLPDGPTSASARATDVNGLASSTVATNVTVDNTPPALDVRGPADRTFAPGSTQVWVLASTDATSGVAGIQCSLVESGTPASFRACSGSPTVEIADNQPPGAYRFTARATDAAGNVTDLTRDFTIAATLEAALAANGGRLPGSDGAGTLAVLPVTVAYDFSAKRNGTRFSALTLKRVPSGAKVRVTCAKGCPRKAFTPKKVKSTLRLTPFLNRRLKPGAVLTVTVSKPGALTLIKRFTIRRGQRPRLESLCRAPGAKKAQRC